MARRALAPCWPSPASSSPTCTTSKNKGPSRPHPTATAPPVPGYTFLENKYYLDTLYTDVIVADVKGPIARAAYWFNQNVLDGIVNGAGVGRQAASAGSSTSYVDQRVVDGVVNGIGPGLGGVRPVPPPHPDRQGAAVRRPPLRRRRRPRRRASCSSSRSHRTNPMKDFLNRLGPDPRDLPAARRRARDAAGPQGEGARCTRSSPWARAWSWRDRRAAAAPTSTTTTAATLQFVVDKPWIPSSTAATSSASTASRCR